MNEIKDGFVGQFKSHYRKEFYRVALIHIQRGYERHVLFPVRSVQAEGTRIYVVVERDTVIAVPFAVISQLIRVRIDSCKLIDGLNEVDRFVDLSVWIEVVDLFVGYRVKLGNFSVRKLGDIIGFLSLYLKRLVLKRCGSIRGIAPVIKGRRRYDVSRSDSFGLDVLIVVCAYSLSRYAAVIVSPDVGGFAPVVSRCGNRDVRRVVTTSAGVVSVPADLGAGRRLCRVVHDVVAERRCYAGLSRVAARAVSSFFTRLGTGRLGRYGPFAPLVGADYNGVRIVDLGGLVRIVRRAFARSADRCDGLFGEYAAFDGQFRSVRRKRTCVLTVKDGDLSAAGCSADNALAAAERVARKGNRHSASVFQPYGIAVCGERGIRDRADPVAAADIDTVLSAGDLTVGDSQVLNAGQLCETVSAFNFESVKRESVGSRSGCDANRYGGCSLAREFAVADGHVMRVIVLAGRVVLTGRLRVRYVDERIVVSFGVVCELDVIDRQSVRTFVSTVAVNVKLTGDCLAVAFDRQVQTGFLMDDRYFGDIVQYLYRNVARHIVSSVDRFLKSCVHDAVHSGGRFDPVSRQRDIIGHGSFKVVCFSRVAEIPSVEDAVLFFGNSRCCCGRAGIDLLARNGASAVGVKGHGVVDSRSTFKRVIRARDHQFGRMIVALPDDQIDGHRRANVGCRKVEHTAVELAYEIDHVAVSHAVKSRGLKQVDTVIRRFCRRIDERNFVRIIRAVEPERVRRHGLVERYSVIRVPRAVVSLGLLGRSIRGEQILRSEFVDFHIGAGYGNVFLRRGHRGHRRGRRTEQGRLILERVVRAYNGVDLGRIVRILDDQFDRDRFADIVIRQVERSADKFGNTRENVVVPHGVESRRREHLERVAFCNGVREYERYVVRIVRSVEAEAFRGKTVVERYSVIRDPVTVVIQSLLFRLFRRELVDRGDLVYFGPVGSESGYIVDILVIDCPEFVDGRARKFGQRVDSLCLSHERRFCERCGISDISAFIHRRGGGNARRRHFFGHAVVCINVVSANRRRGDLAVIFRPDVVDRPVVIAGSYRVRISVLRSSVEVVGREFAFAADCNFRQNGEHAAFDSELAAVGRERSCVLTVKDGDRAAGGRLVDDAFAAAERVARKGDSHSAVAFQSCGVAVCGERGIRDRARSVAAADIDTVLRT